MNTNLGIDKLLLLESMDLVDISIEITSNLQYNDSAKVFLITIKKAILNNGFKDDLVCKDVIVFIANLFNIHYVIHKDFVEFFNE